ncbi:MAG: hypothetical protein ACHP7N_17110, partial [Caulobacterales bacterium]
MDQAITIGPENPDQPEIRDFLAQSDALMASLYPPESNHLWDVAALQGPDCRFLVARQGALALGCVAVVLGSDGAAELKRLFVPETARGLG